MIYLVGYSAPDWVRDVVLVVCFSAISIALLLHRDFWREDD